MVILYADLTGWNITKRINKTGITALDKNIAVSVYKNILDDALDDRLYTHHLYILVIKNALQRVMPDELLVAVLICLHYT